MNEPRIFITSDLHFGHSKNFLWGSRGFRDIENHDYEIIRRWNEVVDKDDIVYVLGDLMLNDNNNGLSCLSLLHGNIKIVRGNHDSDARWEIYDILPNVELLGWAHMMRYKQYHFYLSHYPTLTGNYDDDKPLKAKVINLCGHTHSQDRFIDWDKGIIYHCELDAHNCYPVLLDDIIEEIKEKMNTQQN